MHHRERGAAHINVYFFLVLLVLFIGVLWFGYIQLSEIELARKDAQDSRKQTLAAERELQHYKHYVAEISDVIGVKGDWPGKKGYVWTQRYDGVTPKPIPGVSIPTDVKANLENLAKTLKLSTSQATPIPPFLGHIETLHSQLNDKVKSFKTLAEAAEAKAATLSSEFRKTDQEHTRKLAELSQTYTKSTSDLRNANTKKDQRIATVQADVRKANEEKAALAEEHAGVVKAMKKVIQKKDGQMEAWRALNAMRQPPQVADGSIISASMKANRGWIDIGRKDMLLRGTKFKITDASGKKIKGYGEVIATQQDRAEIRIYNVANAVVDPIVRGDQIYNDLYSPNMKRNVAMIGRFSYPYTKPMVKQILEKLGNKVYDDVRVGVDMVIVGLQDPTESGDGLKPIEDTPGYKEAQALHCEIITLNKIRDLLRLGE